VGQKNLGEQEYRYTAADFRQMLSILILPLNPSKWKIVSPKFYMFKKTILDRQKFRRKRQLLLVFSVKTVKKTPLTN